MLAEVGVIRRVEADEHALDNSTADAQPRHRGAGCRLMGRMGRRLGHGGEAYRPVVKSHGLGTMPDMRIQPGLVSVTFRKLSPAEVVRVAVDAGLTSIEWGGDIHVPHGDLARAKEVAAMTTEAGLSASAYG